MAIAFPVTEPTEGGVGADVVRADAREKVRGDAIYAVEHPAEGVLYGCPVLAEVALGTIRSIDASAAEAVPGVVAVITSANAPAQAAQLAPDEAFFKKLMGPKPVLDRDEVMFFGQYVALVVAESFETARAAAALVRVDVAGAEPMLDFDAALERAYAPKEINGGAPPDTDEGDVDGALAASAVTLDETYDTPYEHANALEPHGALAMWRGDELHVYDTNQSVIAAATSLAATFQIEPTKVRVESRFIGGGFGTKFGLRPHAMLAAIGARVTGKPVKVALSRRDSFSDYGHRTRVRQRMRLGADANGTLAAFSQECWSQTSVDDEFVEQSGAMGRMMYAAPNRRSRHRVTAMHTPTPSFMRAPGEAPGSFAIESAMDELAVKLRMDPIEFRMKNEPDADPESGLPWSSRSLAACLREGAARFGWERRDAMPGRTRDGRWLVGYGVAAATYPYFVLPTSARVTVRRDGTALVEIAAADIGTGAYTVVRQIAADALGLPFADVDMMLGDSTLPPAFGAGGSTGTASFGSAVFGACRALQARLAGRTPEDDAEPMRGERLIALVPSDGATANFDLEPPEEQTFSSHAFGAQFAEIGVDPDTYEVRVRRMVGAFGVGRVINPRTAESQFEGGIVMGIGQALMEETLLDPRWGQWVNRDLAEYHVPVNADVPAIEVFAVDEVDPHINPMGSKGIGEVGIVGVAAAIANAVYNATGIRVRDLPITLDKLLTAV